MRLESIEGLCLISSESRGILAGSWGLLGSVTRGLERRQECGDGVRTRK